MEALHSLTSTISAWAPGSVVATPPKRDPAKTTGPVENAAEGQSNTDMAASSGDAKSVNTSLTKLFNKSPLDLQNALAHDCPRVAANPPGRHLPGRQKLSL